MISIGRISMHTKISYVNIIEHIIFFNISSRIMYHVMQLLFIHPSIQIGWLNVYFAYSLFALFEI